MLMNVVDDDEMRFPLLHTIASILAWMSAVVNPFIYAFKNRQYQQAFTKVITAPDTIMPLWEVGCESWEIRFAQPRTHLTAHI